MESSGLSLYYDYVIDLAFRLLSIENPKALDYGCGAGEIVIRANDACIDCYGVDVFYGGGSLEKAAAKSGLIGTKIKKLTDGRIPMADECFDLVFANQVFEHISDFEKPLSEIHRVLKPGGIFINIFPSAEVWREGHLGVPFIHWFPKGPKLPRFYYALMMRNLGFGHHVYDKSARRWAEDILKWLDDWTFYKPEREIEKLFAERFAIELYDDDYIKFRIRNHPRLQLFSKLIEPSCFKFALTFTSSRLAGHVYVLRKAA